MVPLDIDTYLQANLKRVSGKLPEIDESFKMTQKRINTGNGNMNHDIFIKNHF